MKLVLNFSMLLLAFFSFGNESFSLTNYQIKQSCKKVQRTSTCIKNLQKKKNNLEEGKLIEIPVIPYRGNQKLNFKF